MPSRRWPPFFGAALALSENTPAAPPMVPANAVLIPNAAARLVNSRRVILLPPLLLFSDAFDFFVIFFSLMYMKDD
jgi:hypothetical protein